MPNLNSAGLSVQITARMKGNKMSVNKNLQQPASDPLHPPSTDDKDIGKDFGSLINMPLSKGGHFVFKSEKDWSIADFSSEYSEFFTLNLNTLSVALDSIPFNEYVDVNERYFTVSIRGYHVCI